MKLKVSGRLAYALSLLLMTTLLPSCTERGRQLNQEQFSQHLQELEAAGADRDEVERRLGEPATVFSEKDNQLERWIYYYPNPSQPTKYGAVLLFDSKSGKLISFVNTVAD